MSKTVFRIENGKFGLTMTAPLPTVTPCSAVIADYDEFSCQIQDGALNATANVTQDTVAATFCDPEENVPNVARSSYTLDLTFLQDPQIMTGLSQFLAEHDTETAYFFLGLDGDNPPKAIGKVRVTDAAFGGPARQALTATCSLPVDGIPGRCFGDSTTSVAVPSATTTAAAGATGATSGTPGAFTGGTAPATVAALQGASPAVTASPATAWATGEYVQTGTAGAAGEAYWDGTAWVAGRAP